MKPTAVVYFDKNGLMLACQMTDINDPWFMDTFILTGTHKIALKLKIYRK